MEVAVRIRHRQMEELLFTSVTCTESDWDGVNLRVSPDDPDHVFKNEAVETLFRKVAAEVQLHIDNCLERDFGILSARLHADPEQGDGTPPLRLADVIDRKAQTCRRLNTRRGYESFARYFRARFGDGPDAGMIDNGFVDSFSRRIEEDYKEGSSLRTLMTARLKAVVSFGCAAGLVHLQTRLSFPRYYSATADRNLSVAELAGMGGILKDRLGADRMLHDETTMAFALFMLDVAFQGLAPTDLASLRVRDLSFRSLTGETGGEALEGVVIDTVRRKTGVPLRIVAWLPAVRPLILPMTEGRAPDDYLIPCFDRNREYTDAQRQSRLANFFGRMSGLINRELKASRPSGAGRVTFYYARHAFCNLADSLDMPRHLIQKMVGHRQTVLEKNYLRPPTDHEQALVSRAILSLFLRL